MKKRFDFKDEIFKIAEMLEPTNARSMACRSLNQLFKRFPQLKDSCDPVAAENELKNKALLGTDAFYSCGCKTESEIAALGVEAYWCHLLNLRNSAGLLCYPNLRTCISLLFCLPVSNASSERVFSSLKLIKDPKRNRLEDVTVSSLMRIKGWLKRNNEHADSVIIPSEMLNSVMRVKANAVIGKQ